MHPRRILVAAGLAVGLAMPAASYAQTAAPSCQFQLGFASLASEIPQQVGSCVDNEAHNPINGDALQHTTTGGLLVWRKADNWTAFTDGYHTWINGPNGLQERLNTDRFPWEAPAPASPAPATSPGGQGSLADEIARIAVPDGFPPMAQLPSDQQMGCVHMAESLQKSAIQPTPMQTDVQLCPYADDPNWPGFKTS
jgi:hypothetical protein